MIEFRLSLETLGNTRFGYSPLGELASSLRALGGPPTRPLLRPWLRQVSDELRSLDLDLLRGVVPPGYVAPDFMYAWSPDPRVTIEDQLDGLLRVPTEIVARDLRGVWGDRPVPHTVASLLAGEDLSRLASGLAAYWDVAIKPYWYRIRSAIDDDVAHRANGLLARGLYGLLGELHPEMSVRGDVLAIDKPQHPDAVYARPTITLIPSVFVWPQLLVAHSAPDCFELQYATRSVGRVWEGLTEIDDGADAFAALVGRTRAAILIRLAAPHSTTQLARLLDSSPGSISAHLSVLRRNGLVSAAREGRSVLYRRTALATSILAASDAAGVTGELA